MNWLFNIFSANGWICLNSENFIKAKCFKILTCDPLDDLIEMNATVMAGISKKHSIVNYDTKDFQLFFETLLFVL